MKEKVVVGMSGGVDSSVAAYLLKEQGYEVIGVTMQIWQSEDVCSVSRNGGCCGLEAVEDARRVAWKLDIPHYVMNFRDEFKDKVIDYFIDEYMRARTPNPCNACNRYIKWQALMDRSLSIGANYIATGHYAKIKKLANDRYTIANSVTAQKDQTYALYNLTQNQLKHTLMPVGDYEKYEIRQIAADIGLDVASKKDSQDICFVDDGNYAKFIKEQRPDYIDKPGDFVLEDGTVVGRHEGIIHYTIGQRRGLKVSVGERIFIKKIDAINNQIILAKDEDLFTEELIMDDVNMMSVSEFDPDETYIAKIRYSDKGTPAKVRTLDDGNVKVIFEKPVRAITPGQACVIYIDDTVAGGGSIQ